MTLDSTLREKFEAMNALKQEILALKRSQAPEAVQDYTLNNPDGAQVRLSELFGDKSEMLLIHNMGRRCTYCTLWADGLNGFAAHLANRAAFVLSSPDEPAVLREFAAGRGWKFRTASTHGSTLTHDLGYEPKPGEHWPGVSALRKNADGSIERTARDFFGPGDLYCGIWHLFDLLPQGVNGWEPKYTYA